MANPNTQNLLLAQQHVTRWEIDLCHKFRGNMQRDVNEQFVVFNPLTWELLSDKSIAVNVQVNVNRYVRMNFSRVIGRYANEKEEVLRMGDEYSYIKTKGI